MTVAAVDMRLLKPIAEMAGEGDEETRLFREMHASATSYVEKRAWCGRIVRSSFGGGVGGVVAVFMFEVEPKGTSWNDRWVWIVVGDIPSAFLVPDVLPDPVSALKMYCELMLDWVDAVAGGKDLSKVFRVEAKPTRENAIALLKRIRHIQQEIIPCMEEGLDEAK